MQQSGFTAKTKLSVREVADAFQEAVSPGFHKRVQLAMARGLTKANPRVEWGTPEDDAFVALDDDPADFSVYAAVPRRSNYAGNTHVNTWMHLYVWDRGDHREAWVSGRDEYSTGLHRRRLLWAVKRRLAATDPGAVFRED